MTSVFYGKYKVRAQRARKAYITVKKKCLRFHARFDSKGKTYIYKILNMKRARSAGTITAS